MAAGGQGAPLVPLAHWHLFSGNVGTRVIQNLGGIGNVTVLPPSGKLSDVFAFDTGPANMVLDGLIRHYTQGQHHVDRGGKWALKGTVNQRLSNQMLKHPYFRIHPPKSTGRHEFGAAFIQEFVQKVDALGLSKYDALATALELTVESIARAYQRFIVPRVPIKEAIVTGGGVQNPALMERLQKRLTADQIHMRKSQEFGVNPDAVEAIAFAILAYETLFARPGNVPLATGASGPRVLGVLAPGNNWSRMVALQGKHGAQSSTPKKRS